MIDKNNEVLFGEYCKTCKYERYSETDSPCAECLAEPVNLYSHKPVKWEGADGIYAGPPPRPDHAYQRAVKYVPENRKDREKAIARHNIDAEYTGNKVQTIDDKVTDDQYPSATAVKKALEGANEATAQSLAKKIDAPDTCECGDVLTVEEIDENGKPTKWKTAPAATEQKQADWYEQDSTKPSYIKNGFAKLEFTKKEAPLGGSTTEGFYQYLVSAPSGRPSLYVCYQLSVLIAPDTYDTIYVDIDPTNETATVNNIKVAIEELSKRYNITNISIFNGGDKGVYYLTPKDNPVRVYICGVKANSEIDVRFLPSPDFAAGDAGIFKALPVNNTAELNNLKPVKYYNSYTNPDAATSDKFPSLYAEKEIKTFDTFDFNTIVLCQGSSEKFSLCYTSNIGNACTGLGITKDDLPIMSYLTGYSVGSPPSGTYYIETATNKRFIAKYRYGTTTWSYIKKISGASSAFYINITSTTDDSGNTTYSADKTADEIIAACESRAVMIGVYGEFYMQGVVHIANPVILSLIFAAQELNSVNGEIIQRQCSVNIDKDNKEMQVSYGVATKILDKGIVFMVNNNTVQTSPNSGSFDEILQTIESSIALSKSINIILAKDRTGYNLSRLERKSNNILITFDDVANSKTYIVFADAKNKAFTYSEEDLPKGGDNTLGITTAAVGQTIKVKSVDTTGKPTEWEAADLPSGGGETWEKLVDTTLAEAVESVTYSFDNCKRIKVLIAPTIAHDEVFNGWIQITINNVVYPSFNGRVNYYEGICFRIDSEYPPYVQGDINTITNATTYGLVVGRHAAILENIAPNGVMEFGCRTAELLKAGTKIEIWGVKS